MPQITVKRKPTMIKCELCGSMFALLNAHLYYKHGLSSEQYREMFPNAIFMSPQMIEAISIKMLGNKNALGLCRSSEALAISGAKIKALWADPNSIFNSEVYREKLRLAPRGQRTDAFREKQRQLHLGVKETSPCSEERKRKISEKARQRWQDPVFARKNFEAISCRNRMTTLERKLSYILRFIVPHQYRFNGDGRLCLNFGGIYPDFVNVDGHKKVIEVFTPYWKIRDWETVDRYIKVRQAHLAKIGFSVLFIDEIEFNDREKLKLKIQRFVEK